MSRNQAQPPPLPPMSRPPGTTTVSGPPPLLQPAPLQAGLAPPPRRHSILLRTLFGLAAIALMAGGGAWLLNASIDPAEDVEGQAAPTRRELLTDVKSWGYQLQKFDTAAAARSPHDLLVIDEAFEGPERTQRRNETLRALKRKPDGGRRLVLAYLSIGEAEDYRAYWGRDWVASGLMLQPARSSDFSAISPAQASPRPAETTVAVGRSRQPLRAPTLAAPAWLGDENTAWRGNFRVRYWDAGWQAMIFGSETAALERIIDAGFDGVYLDRADVHQGWLKERPQARADMEALIQRVSSRGRELSPGFVVVMQNAEELLASSRVRGALDAVAKEDLLFGIDGDAKPNAERDVAASLQLLKTAQRQGLPVLVVEYLSDDGAIARARQKLDANGFIPYFAPRALDGLRASR